MEWSAPSFPVVHDLDSLALRVNEGADDLELFDVGDGGDEFLLTDKL